MVIDKNDFKDKIDTLTYATAQGESTPRGRILDRNLNVIVDNIAVRTITYTKQKGTKNGEMIDLAYNVIGHVDIDISKLTTRSKKEFYVAKFPNECKKLIKKSEYEKLEQKKLTVDDIYELKIDRITDEMLNELNEEDLHAAQLYYLMNSGYAYSEKTIKSNVSDEEYSYISENNTT